MEDPERQVRRVRCQDERGDETYLAVAVLGEHIYLLINKRRVRLTTCQAIALLTAIGECHWRLATGRYYVEGEDQAGLTS